MTILNVRKDLDYQRLIFCKKKKNRFYLSILRWSEEFNIFSHHGVVVITSSSHAESPRLEPAWWHFRMYERISIIRDWYFVKNGVYQSFLSNLTWSEVYQCESPWCSGHHICLTRRRSAVRARVVTFFNVRKDLDYQRLISCKKPFLSEFSDMIWRVKTFPVIMA